MYCIAVEGIFHFFMRIFLVFIVIFTILHEIIECRGGRRAGKGKGKSNLQFAQVAEFSLIQTPPADNRVILISYLNFFNFNY